MTTGRKAKLTFKLTHPRLEARYLITVEGVLAETEEAGRRALAIFVQVFRPSPENLRDWMLDLYQIEDGGPPA